MTGHVKHDTTAKYTHIIDELLREIASFMAYQPMENAEEEQPRLRQ